MRDETLLEETEEVKETTGSQRDVLELLASEDEDESMHGTGAAGRSFGPGWSGSCGLASCGAVPLCAAERDPPAASSPLTVAVAGCPEADDGVSGSARGRDSACGIFLVSEELPDWLAFVWGVADFNDTLAGLSGDALQRSKVQRTIRKNLVKAARACLAAVAFDSAAGAPLLDVLCTVWPMPHDVGLPDRARGAARLHLPRVLGGVVPLCGAVFERDTNTDLIPAVAATQDARATFEEMFGSNLLSCREKCLASDEELLAENAKQQSEPTDEFRDALFAPLVNQP